MDPVFATTHDLERPHGFLQSHSVRSPEIREIATYLHNAEDCDFEPGILDLGTSEEMG